MKLAKIFTVLAVGTMLSVSTTTINAAETVVLGQSDELYDSFSQIYQMNFSDQDANYGLAVNDKGLFATYDKGENWEPFATDKFSHKWRKTTSLSAVALDPDDHDTIYAGAGGFWSTEDPRTNANRYKSRDNGVVAGTIFKSTDGGESWSAETAGLPATSEIGQIFIHPQNNNKLYVATSHGNFISNDGGATYEPINDGLADPESGEVYVRDLAFHYNEAEDQVTLVTALLTIWENKENEELTHTSGGIYKSLDEGKTWESLNDGLLIAYTPDLPEIEDWFTAKNKREITEPQYILPSFREVEIDPQNPNILYAIRSSQEQESDIWNSKDGGQTWNHIDYTAMEAIKISALNESTDVVVASVVDVTKSNSALDEAVDEFTDAFAKTGDTFATVGKTVTGAGKAVVDAGKAVVDAGKAVIDAGKAVWTAGGALVSAGGAVVDTVGAAVEVVSETSVGKAVTGVVTAAGEAAADIAVAAGKAIADATTSAGKAIADATTSAGKTVVEFFESDDDEPADVKEEETVASSGKIVIEFFGFDNDDEPVDAEEAVVEVFETATDEPADEEEGIMASAGKKVIEFFSFDKDDEPADTEEGMMTSEEKAKAIEDATKSAEKAIEDATKSAEKAIEDATKSAEKAIEDATKSAEKAIEDATKSCY